MAKNHKLHQKRPERLADVGHETLHALHALHVLLVRRRGGSGVRHGAAAADVLALVHGFGPIARCFRATSAIKVVDAVAAGARFRGQRRHLHLAATTATAAATDAGCGCLFFVQLSHQHRLELVLVNVYAGRRGGGQRRWLGRDSRRDRRRDRRRNGRRVGLLPERVRRLAAAGIATPCTGRGSQGGGGGGGGASLGGAAAAGGQLLAFGQERASPERRSFAVGVGVVATAAATATAAAAVFPFRRRRQQAAVSVCVAVAVHIDIVVAVVVMVLTVVGFVPLVAVAVAVTVFVVFVVAFGQKHFQLVVRRAPVERAEFSNRAHPVAVVEFVKLVDVPVAIVVFVFVALAAAAAATGNTDAQTRRAVLVVFVVFIVIFAVVGIAIEIGIRNRLGVCTTELRTAVGGTRHGAALVAVGWVNVDEVRCLVDEVPLAEAVNQPVLVDNLDAREPRGLAHLLGPRPVAANHQVRDFAGDLALQLGAKAGGLHANLGPLHVHAERHQARQHNGRALQHLALEPVEDLAHVGDGVHNQRRRGAALLVVLFVELVVQLGQVLFEIVELRVVVEEDAVPLCRLGIGLATLRGRRRRFGGVFLVELFLHMQQGPILDLTTSIVFSSPRTGVAPLGGGVPPLDTDVAGVAAGEAASALETAVEAAVDAGEAVTSLSSFLTVAASDVVDVVEVDVEVDAEVDVGVVAAAAAAAAGTAAVAAADEDDDAAGRSSRFGKKLELISPVVAVVRPHVGTVVHNHGHVCADREKALQRLGDNVAVLVAADDAVAKQALLGVDNLGNVGRVGARAHGVDVQLVQVGYGGQKVGQAGAHLDVVEAAARDAAVLALLELEALHVAQGFVVWIGRVLLPLANGGVDAGMDDGLVQVDDEAQLALLQQALLQLLFRARGGGVADGEVCLVVGHVDGGAVGVALLAGPVDLVHILAAEGAEALELDLVGARLLDGDTGAVARDHLADAHVPGEKRAVLGRVPVGDACECFLLELEGFAVLRELHGVLVRVLQDGFLALDGVAGGLVELCDFDGVLETRAKVQRLLALFAGSHGGGGARGRGILGADVLREAAERRRDKADGRTGVVARAGSRSRSFLVGRLRIGNKSRCEVGDGGRPRARGGWWLKLKREWWWRVQRPRRKRISWRWLTGIGGEWIVRCGSKKNGARQAKETPGDGDDDDNEDDDENGACRVANKKRTKRKSLCLASRRPDVVVLAEELETARQPDDRGRIGDENGTDLTREKDSESSAGPAAVDGAGGESEAVTARAERRREKKKDREEDGVGGVVGAARTDDGPSHLLARADRRGRTSRREVGKGRSDADVTTRPVDRVDRFGTL
ncbi:uncharacterized protein SPSK_01373 [Sporothrix schenckii 1099-18]|uniref:Uncharacterized protein n=1 Tax=Sporothrix schenckii 1099-18 TaxID=1397361 RepID=A0A0F2MEM4_SPOSC|nr:uncharacterized protein SPSK_01373 [Sporothrix schenckii 1099-18]KJR87524.1 hypothetical protein SPSK_01373 [Sporothrix schenckii 1099-18]